MHEEKTDGMPIVFPNPTATGNFAVEAPFALESVRIYSLTGELIYHKEISGLNKAHINVTLTKGIYLVNVLGNNQKYLSRRIVF
ncbi:MAG: hypothetical protein A2Y87_09230 [Bacteroidetes bacterium RBG_13_46_8]|nr:MAG: hypothetical protein A2Y87_09230 [Bacteroidetes bacterium RBG_13_46_8]